MYRETGSYEMSTIETTLQNYINYKDDFNSVKRKTAEQIVNAIRDYFISNNRTALLLTPDIDDYHKEDIDSEDEIYFDGLTEIFFPYYTSGSDEADLYCITLNKESKLTFHCVLLHYEPSFGSEEVGDEGLDEDTIVTSVDPVILMEIYKNLVNCKYIEFNDHCLRDDWESIFRDSL